MSTAKVASNHINTLPLDEPVMIQSNVRPRSASSPSNTLPAELLGYQITDSERVLIAEIKKRLSNGPLPPRYDDIRICRFLRREQTVEKTEAMIRREMKWREEVRPDKIYETFPQNKYFKSLVKYWPGNFHGVDKFGVPLYCERLGQIDLHSLLGEVPADTLLEFHIYTIERNDRLMTQHYERLGAPVGFVYLMDLNGLSIRHYTPSSIDILKRIQAIDDNYYPEILRKVYVLNTPSVFSMFWSLAKVVMHKRSVAKFCVLKKKYQEEISEVATPDNIPQWLNGQCKSCEHHNNGCKFGGDKFHMI